MRIACLQFAPQVGDINNNLDRADAVLRKADPEDIDVLVLPELAFSGYNFRTLQHISPFLEPTVAGISSLWARTTALKYNCVVIVGYPEKTDISSKLPLPSEYYSSSIVVNADGETIANYRKYFLYHSDEAWAREGPDGFFDGEIEGLGQVAIGMGMDMNPYPFGAPWSAREFAYHILHKEANLVIISMAWLTRESKSSYCQTPESPDIETLSHWLARLEPVIRAETEGEIIVVLANRTGAEDEAVYAGTSAVLGIHAGEVKVYGMLGRWENELLIVDTSKRPCAKLVAELETVTPNVVTATSDKMSATSDQITPASNQVTGKSDKTTVSSGVSRTWTSIFTENSDLSARTRNTAPPSEQDTKWGQNPLHQSTPPRLWQLSLPYQTEGEIEEDIKSNESADSCRETISSSGQSLADQEIKDKADNVILGILARDKVLSPLFAEALKKFDTDRVVKNLARFIKGYCRLLSRAQPSADQKKCVKFLRHRARQFAALICEELDPLKLAHALERSKSCSAEKKARLAHWVLGASSGSSPTKFSTASDEEDGSETDSLNSSNGLPPVLEDIKEFMVLGEPLKLFRHYFARFAAGESIKEWNALIKGDDGLSPRQESEILPTHNQPLQTRPISLGAVLQDAITLHPDKKSFRVFWRCRCNRRFEARIPGTNRRVAEEFLCQMDWNVQRDGPMVTHLFTSKWLEDLIWTLAPGLLGRFSWETSTISANSSDLEAGGGSGFGRTISGSSGRSSDLLSGGFDGSPVQEMDIGTRPISSTTRITDPIYVCLYKRKGGFWRLRHAKLPRFGTKSQPRGNNTIELPAYSLNMNKVLFLALREKLLRKRSSRTSEMEWSASLRQWKLKIGGCLRRSTHWLLQLFNPISISGFEFWEFKLNPAPKLVDPVQKDKLPQEPGLSQTYLNVMDLNGHILDEWEYFALTGQDLNNFKGLIGGSFMLHLLKYPDDVKPDLPIWTGLPKKIRTKLINQDRVQKAGWGFQVEYEWNSAAFVVMMCPIIVLGFLIATFLSIKFQWPISAGVTLALAPLTVVTFINTILGGIVKQKDLSK